MAHEVKNESNKLKFNYKSFLTMQCCLTNYKRVTCSNSPINVHFSVNWANVTCEDESHV
jgi:hypothetical protein